MYNLNFDIWKFGHPQFANSANGALSKLTFSGDRGEEYRGQKSQPVTVETGMTELDCSGKYLVVSGAIILSAVLLQFYSLLTKGKKTVSH